MHLLAPRIVTAGEALSVMTLRRATPIIASPSPALGAQDKLRVAPEPIGVLRALEAMDVPFVRISPGTNHALTSSVFMDDAQAADDMTTHLLNLGHRRIGFIKGHPSHMASDERLFGYHRALDRLGIAYEPGLVAEGAFDFDSGVEAGRWFLARDARPTAIFASNDDMEIGRAHV